MPSCDAMKERITKLSDPKYIGEIKTKQQKCEKTKGRTGKDDFCLIVQKKKRKKLIFFLFFPFPPPCPLCSQFCFVGRFDRFGHVVRY